MSEKSKAVTLQTATSLCESLLNTYGEPSHYGRAVQHASFEINDHDGREYKVLLLQKAVGSQATYSLRLRESLGSSSESIYGLSHDGDTVEHKIKQPGGDINGPYQWPAATLVDLLADCHGKQSY